MADPKPGETATPTPAPAPAPAAPDPNAKAIKAAVADLERRAVEAVGRGDQAAVERLREEALKITAAGKPRA